MRECFIIFHDSDELHLRWMKKGFRHAFIVVREDQTTIILDLLSGSYRIENHVTIRRCDLLNFWDDMGYRYISVKQGRAGMWLPGPLSCVTVIKRFLGLVKPTIITPWQLFSYLDKKQNADRVKREHKGTK